MLSGNTSEGLVKKDVVVKPSLSHQRIEQLAAALPAAGL